MKNIYKEITLSQLTDILGLTIKKDEENRIITFLCMLSAYTESSQFNISYNAPSSAGKSYIPMEIAKLFPKEDIRMFAYASPASFFHDVEQSKDDENVFINDLSRKIIIFLDMPDTTLVARLRPVLSHDQKITESKITDRTEKKGMRTKRIQIIGYPSVIFCSANLKMDEQESTRFFVLSPEISQEKIRAGIEQTILKEADQEAYDEWLNSNPDRILLQERIIAIKKANIQDVKLESPDILKEYFMRNKEILKPRHQRDIRRFISLVKAHALLNMFSRKVVGSTLYANTSDVEAVFPVWNSMATAQELNIPPYVYNLFNDIFVPLNEERNKEDTWEMGKVGLTRQDILNKHYEIYKRTLNSNTLTTQILPVLESSGLIAQEPDRNNLRQKLIYITGNQEPQYDNEGCGVDNQIEAPSLEEMGFSEIPF